jgi:hypothetical protein
MSGQEQDAVIGRMVREHAASLASGLAHNINPEFNLNVA